MIPDPRDVILAPVISEKSYGLLDEEQYTFIVRPEANKTADQDRGRADLQRQGARREHAQPSGQAQAQQGTGIGKRKDTKRAIVSLAAGDRIEIFGGPGA